MAQRIRIIATAALLGLGSLLAESAAAQDLQGLYRITGGASASHVEYHSVPASCS
jgi:hypothetical protein